VVHQIERLPSELQPAALPDREIPAERHVERHRPWTVQNVTARVAESVRTGRHDWESANGEPLATRRSGREFIQATSTSAARRIRARTRRSSPRTPGSECRNFLDGKTRPRKQKHDFPYTGIITCGHCGCQLVAEIKKGRYVYYHCTNGNGTDCPEPYTRQERLTDELTAVLGELVVPKALTDWLRAALHTTDTTQTKAREDALAHATAELHRVESRIEAMYLDKLDGRITASFFDEKASQWRQEQAKLKARINELQHQTRNHEDAINAIETTSTPGKEFPTQPQANSDGSSPSSSTPPHGKTESSKQSLKNTLSKTPGIELGKSKKRQAKQRTRDGNEELAPQKDEFHTNSQKRKLLKGKGDHLAIEVAS
jgi:hypothetical protein